MNERGRCAPARTTQKETMHRQIFFVLLLSTLTFAQAPTPKKSATSVARKPAAEVAKPASAGATVPSEQTAEAFLHQMFGYDSTISSKVVEIKPFGDIGLAQVDAVIANTQGQKQFLTFYISPDQKHAIAGEVIPFGPKPFAEAHARLEKGVNGPVRGPAKAPVTIVEFSDLQCPHCKVAAPNLEKLLAEEPNVHFVFQNYPLPMHNWAAKAAAYSDCVGLASNDAVWKFIQKTYDAQTDITEANADQKLTAIANDSGVKGDEIAACAAKPESKSRLEASLALGRAVGVTGTPTIFINGRKTDLGGAPIEYLKNLVEFEAKQAK